ncbi:MAG: anti-sigma factor family protein [Dehalococcoidia bacterium]
MKCEEVRDLLPEYLEGTLKGRKLRALEKHLQGCEVCQQELESIREMDARLSEDIPRYWENINPRPEFLARLRQMDFEASRPQSVSVLDALSGFWMRYRTGLVTSVSICIVAVILVMVVPTLISPMGEEEALEQTPAETPAPQEGAEERAFSGKGAEPTETESATGLEGPQGPQGARTPGVTTSEGLTVDSQDLAASAEITGYTPEKAERAIDIALNNSRVQSILANVEIVSVEEVRESIEDIENWTGPVVVMTLSGAEDQQESQLSVYVDLDEGRVVEVKHQNISSK